MPYKYSAAYYSIEHTPTEASAGGALLYMNNRLSYKPRADLKMYAPGKLESIFIEIICPNTPNLIIGCIYKHSMLHTGDFNSNYISPLLHKLSKESSKQYFYWVTLILTNLDMSNSFLDTMSSNFLSPQIILPTRISSPSALINNIFCNPIHTIKSISGNLASTLSDHLPQFLILLEFFSNEPPSKYNIYTHDGNKFDEEKFIFEFNSQDWDNILVLDKENVNETIDNYLQQGINRTSKRESFNKNLGSQKDYKSQLTKKLSI